MADAEKLKKRGRPKTVKLVDGNADKIAPDTTAVVDKGTVVPALRWGITTPLFDIRPILLLHKWNDMQSLTKADKQYRYADIPIGMVKWGEKVPYGAYRYMEAFHKDMIFDTREEALKAQDELLRQALPLLDNPLPVEIAPVDKPKPVKKVL